MVRRFLHNNRGIRASCLSCGDPLAGVVPSFYGLAHLVEVRPAQIDLGFAQVKASWAVARRRSRVLIALMRWLMRDSVTPSRFPISAISVPSAQYQ